MSMANRLAISHPTNSLEKERERTNKKLLLRKTFPIFIIWIELETEGYSTELCFSYKKNPNKNRVWRANGMEDRTDRPTEGKKGGKETVLLKKLAGESLRFIWNIIIRGCVNRALRFGEESWTGTETETDYVMFLFTGILMRKVFSVESFTLRRWIVLVKRKNCFWKRAIVVAADWEFYLVYCVWHVCEKLTGIICRRE